MKQRLQLKKLTLNRIIEACQEVEEQINKMFQLIISKSLQDKRRK